MVNNIGLKFKKTSVTIDEKNICHKNKCGKQPIKSISKPIISYEVNDDNKKEILVLGKDKDNYLTAVLYDENMKLKKSNDSKNYNDYYQFSKSVLHSHKKFSDEGDIGKARITYQLLNYW
ncbi:MAG: hypothetical protein WC934_06235 [Acidithiobacillus sp.]|jgi:hypothetical protein|uniref:hypothetical protein n=1 Tax=Acidithiobacillus sp. TaxID=1872118 RepID=UPI00355F1CE5